MKKILSVALMILVIALSITHVYAIEYPDIVGDGVSNVEDMTTCYITHNDTVIKFRVEFIEGGCGSRVLLIYLDVDQNQSTGDTGTDWCYGYDFDLHDIGADYRLQMNTPDPDGVYTYSHWFKTADFTHWNQAEEGFIEIEIMLSDIGNPTFPIDVLFVSTETDLVGTDYNPNISHITHPPVGGTILSTNNLMLIAPLLLLLSVLIAGTTGILLKKRIL